MGRITLTQAAQWCGGLAAEKYAQVSFLGAENALTRLKPGMLYVADSDASEQELASAMEKGAAAVLCTGCESDIPALKVADVRQALGMIARQERQRIGMKTVWITGFVGKSTTKEMADAILRTTYRVGKTPVNMKDPLAMPMSILGMEEDTQVAVFELAVSEFQDVTYLGSVGRPDVGMILNISMTQVAHIDSIEGVLLAKLEILEGMDRGTRLFLNGDDPLLWNLHKQHDLSPVYFGVQNPACRILGKDVQENPGLLRFRARAGDQEFPVELPLQGQYHVLYALAAVGIALELGVPTEQIRRSMAQFQTASEWTERTKTDKYTLIRDYANAGPESMMAALTALGSQHGRRIAVIADMPELGICSQAEHYKVGRIAAENADLVFACGEESLRVLYGCITGGMPETKARAFTDGQRLVGVLKQVAEPGDVILFKGSNAAQMEQLLTRFLEEEK